MNLVSNLEYCMHYYLTTKIRGYLVRFYAFHLRIINPELIKGFFLYSYLGSSRNRKKNSVPFPIELNHKYRSGFLINIHNRVSHLSQLCYLYK